MNTIWTFTEIQYLFIQNFRTMEYLLPKDLSFKFNTSLKTVYNYINKYGDKIRTKKEYWKTLVSLQDFTEVFQKVTNQYSNPVWKVTEKQTETVVEKEVWTPTEPDSELQEAFNAVLSKKEELEVVLDEKERQLAKYGELYMDVKKEKKELETKFDSLQKEHITRIEDHANELIQSAKKYSRLLIITSITVVVLLFLALLYSYPELLTK